MKKCLDKETDAPLHFKSSLQDPSSCLYTCKAEEDDCCKWIGIMCNNKTGHVRELDMSLCGLEGEGSGERWKSRLGSHMNRPLPTLQLASSLKI
ncbi:unnamed protein product [Lactuca saligna]|uniref:Leucine-rich repeat-containing N-terminal plant-type domain-containing protein n=1 Tax=Lactuca saligna TaxID=75948 RepID=A0AA35YKC1_LACSI|nr:unnamed protein product [Lactuca saligna]